MQIHKRFMQWHSKSIEIRTIMKLMNNNKNAVAVLSNSIKHTSRLEKETEALQDLHKFYSFLCHNLKISAVS